MIKIIGLGPGSEEALTLGALRALKNEEHIYFRTEKHPTVEYIKSLGIKFNTYDNNYERNSSFDEVYKSIAEDLIKKHEEHGEILYGVPGHPLVAEKSVEILLKLCKSFNIETEILPAASFIDALMESLKIDPIEGIKIVDAFNIEDEVLDKRNSLVLTQVYNRSIASDVKLKLMEYYRDDLEIYFVRAAGIKELETIRKIPLYMLDRQEDIDYLTSVYIPKDLSSSVDFYDLIKIMKRLRGENGCPWDKEQTHKSLKKYLIEEAYEVAEAIDKEEDEGIIEELGDVLLQVVFHAEIGEEEGYYNIRDIIKGICEKMINRHPHIFSDVHVENSNEVLDNWDKIKKEEKGLESYTDELKHVAKSLPALIRAFKVQEKAAKAGFDFQSVEPLMDKVLEELDEVKNVYKVNNRAKILEEVGDLIFSTVNISRFLDIDPENALNYTIDKFISRFQYIEETSEKLGFRLDNMSLQQMDELWEKAKIK